MSMFLVFLIGLIALALAFVLPSLLRKPQPEVAGAAVDAGRANLQVLREQLAALDVELASGTLDKEQHRLARIEIERRALEEEQAAWQAPVAGRAGKTAIGLGLLVPVFAVVVYALVGNPQAMLPQHGVAAKGGDGDLSMTQIEAMVEKLARRLETKTTTDAGDEEAWTMLARSFAALQRFPEASRAYERARALAPGSAQLMADHADVLAMLQGQRIQGEPLKLVNRALQLDPKNIKALALAGSAAFEAKDYARALKTWGEALQLAPPGSEFATGLAGSMEQARVALAGGAQVAAAAPATAPVVAAAQNNTGPAANPVKPAGAVAPTSGVVQLAGVLAGKVAPTDTVFVFARAAQGPRMPLAILKRKASDLPLSFSLDDSSAMSPEMKLSNFPSVVIGARISRSGDAMPQSGDLIGQFGPVATGSGKLVVVIDAVQP